MANKTIKQISLSEENEIFFRFSGSSRIVKAKALEVRKNSNDEIDYLLLDRLIHDCKDCAFSCDLENQNTFTLNVSGPYVTELSRV